jgi:hypothetical protein
MKTEAKDLLYAICIALDLEVWDDFPAGDVETILKRVEESIQARELAAFLRGNRATKAAMGMDPEGLPEIYHLSEVAEWTKEDAELAAKLGPFDVAGVIQTLISIPKEPEDDPTDIVGITGPTYGTHMQLLKSLEGIAKAGLLDKFNNMDVAAVTAKAKEAFPMCSDCPGRYAVRLETERCARIAETSVCFVGSRERFGEQIAEKIRTK